MFSAKASMPWAAASLMSLVHLAESQFCVKKMRGKESVQSRFHDVL